jgi:hypothetical protein
VNRPPELVGRLLLELDYKIDELTAKRKELAAELLDQLPVGETLTVDGQPIYEVRAGSARWNDTVAAEFLKDQPQIVEAISVTKTTLDRAKAKELLPPAFYRGCCKVGEPTLVRK